MMSLGQNTVSGEMLRSFVERLERIAEQKSDLTADANVVKAEAKQHGFVPKFIDAVVKIRKLKPSEYQEAEALLDSYKHAMGMVADTPLFRTVDLMSVDVTSKEQVVEAMKKFVPANGSITIDAGGAPVRMTRDKDGNVSVTEVVERPVEPKNPAAKPGAALKAPVPDVDVENAERLGAQAFRDDMPIIRNPFPFGDHRRPAWDKGWRDASGTDGMGD